MQPQAPVPDRAGRKDALHTGLIVLVALASHGLLLFSDGRVGDDWLYLHWLENHKWETYKRFHDLYNNFYQAAPLWPVTYLSNVAAALHVLSFAVIALSGIVVYRIGRVVRYFSSTECFLIAALSVCYPAFMWYASSIYSVFYNLPVLVFLLATYVALVSESHAGARRYGLQILSLIAYLYSFHAGSLLVFFYGAAIVHGYVLASINRLDWKQAVVYYCTRRVHFLLCPIAFRAAYQIFSHPYITNEIRTDIETYTGGLLQFARTILSQAGELLAHDVFWIVAIGGALVVGVARLRARGATTPAAGPGYRWRDLLGLLSFGVVLLLLGVFAYIATGKTPYEGVTTGYSTRTLLLAQVPVAVILVSLLRFISLGALTRPLVYPIAAALIAGSIALQAREHLKWLHLAVLARSFEINLSRTPGARDITYFVVVDRAFYMGHVHHPVASIPFQVADLFRGKAHVFGDLPPAFDLRNARVPQKSLDALIAEYTVSGGRSLVDEWQLVLPTEYRQGVLIVCPGPEFHYRSPVRMAASYQFYRWFKPERLPRFLTPLLQLKLVTPDSPKSASDDALGADPVRGDEPEFCARPESCENRAGIRRLREEQSTPSPPSRCFSRS